MNNSKLCIAGCKPDILNITQSDVWLLKITPEREIIFNKEEFPQYGVDEFVTEFIEIVEDSTKKY